MVGLVKPHAFTREAMLEEPGGHPADVLQQMITMHDRGVRERSHERQRRESKLQAKAVQPPCFVSYSLIVLFYHRKGLTGKCYCLKMFAGNN